MKARIKSIMRGIRMGIDPSMAVRTVGPVVGHADVYEAIVDDWCAVGTDLNKAVQRYGADVEGGLVTSRT